MKRRTALRSVATTAGALLCGGCADLLKADLVDEFAGSERRIYAITGNDLPRWPKSHKVYVFLEEGALRERCGPLVVSSPMTERELSWYTSLAEDLRGADREQ